MEPEQKRRRYNNEVAMITDKFSEPSGSASIIMVLLEKTSNLRPDSLMRVPISEAVCVLLLIVIPFSKIRDFFHILKKHNDIFFSVSPSFLIIFQTIRTTRTHSPFQITTQELPFQLRPKTRPL